MAQHAELRPCQLRDRPNSSESNEWWIVGVRLGEDDSDGDRIEEQWLLRLSVTRKMDERDPLL
jgi:hypothetical protein